MASKIHGSQNPFCEDFSASEIEPPLVDFSDSSYKEVYDDEEEEEVPDDPNGPKSDCQSANLDDSKATHHHDYDNEHESHGLSEIQSPQSRKYDDEEEEDHFWPAKDPEMLQMYMLNNEGGGGNCDQYEADSGSYFDCRFCERVATEPVVTMCGHLYCWPCLSSWLCNHENCRVCDTHIRDSPVTPIYKGFNSWFKKQHSPMEFNACLSLKNRRRLEFNACMSLKRRRHCLSL